MNFEQEFNLTFGEKYRDLRLKEVVVKKREGVCTITFLYPSVVAEISPAEKKEIISWAKDLLQLDGLELKVKFLRVFVEEKLIRQAIDKFFVENHKIVTTYLHKEHVKIDITNIDVLIDIALNKKIAQYFEEKNIASQLDNFLTENFLVSFVVNSHIDETIADELDLDAVEIKATFKQTQRYSVEIVKEMIGKDIITKPEYLSFINGPKESVVVAGFISKIERKDFIRKTGKFAGTSKAYYTFILDDEKGKMDCIYFCPKTNIQLMESLEESMYLLLHGNVEKSKITNKLVLIVDKMALASKEFDIPKPVEEYTGGKNKNNVVTVEKLSSTAQSNMFNDGTEYNDTVSGKNIVVFDIETTGLDLSNDQIIEIGAVKLEDGKIREKFSSFVKPTIAIPYEVTRLTGITDEMVKGAPSAEAVLKEFYEFSKDCILCGHNVIGFDLVILKRMARECGIEFKNDVIDTLNLARHSHILVKNFKLGTIVKYLGLTLEGAHRAWNDAYATAEVLLKLCEKNR